MKTKLITSIASFKKQVVAKKDRIKEVLLNVTEEVGAWLLVSGICICIFWVAGIMFSN